MTCSHAILGSNTNQAGLQSVTDIYKHNLRLYLQHCPLFTELSCRADGACRLAISTESEARWYIDAGQLAMESGHDDPPQVQCPTTIAVGSSISGAVTYLAAEGTKQVHRFPKGRLERSVSAGYWHLFR